MNDRIILITLITTWVFLLTSLESVTSKARSIRQEADTFQATNRRREHIEALARIHEWNRK